jgi:hypothetical protein
MPDHLTIEVLGVLRGSADGPLAVALLGTITLAAVIMSIGRFVLKYAGRINSAINRPQYGTQRRNRTTNAHRRSEASPPPDCEANKRLRKSHHPLIPLDP